MYLNYLRIKPMKLQNCVEYDKSLESLLHWMYVGPTVFLGLGP